MSHIGIIERTMEGLEQGLQVQHIATFEPLRVCGLEDSVSNVLADPAALGIDQFPVKKDKEVVGILVRLAGYQDGARVEEVYDCLRDCMLVSADEPIAHYIEICGTPPYYRLVVKGDKIQGIVTRGDLHKLPVRVVAFAFVTHLEMVLAEVIERKWPDEAWCGRLNAKRLEKAEKEQDKRVAGRAEISLLECTQFCDKRELVRKAYNLKGQFTRDLKDIECLRNSLAHASCLVQSNKTLPEFVGRVAKAKKWIRELHERLKSRTNGGTDACAPSHPSVADCKTRRPRKAAARQAESSD